MIQGNSRFVKSSPDLMQTPLWENDALFKLYHFLLYRLNHVDTVWQTSLDKGTQRKTTENELPSLTQCTA